MTLCAGCLHRLVSVLFVTAGVMLQSYPASASVNTTTPSYHYDNHTADNTTTDNTTTTTSPTSLLDASPYEHWQIALIAVACSVLVLGTLIGNMLVVTAVIIVRRLRTHSNLLIMSLAISDLLVALLDMPFAAIYEVGLINL